jgi:hypothetical protein
MDYIGPRVTVEVLILSFFLWRIGVSLVIGVTPKYITCLPTPESRESVGTVPNLLLACAF